MTYTGPVNACGYPLEAVVKTATIAFPSPYDTKPKATRRGRVTRMSGPSVVSGNGSTCKIWRGSIRTTIGERMRFSVETPLTGSPARAADRRAVKTARTLRRALAKGRSRRGEDHLRGAGHRLRHDAAPRRDQGIDRPGGAARLSG